MKNSKILFTDLDGTLLSDDKTVSVHNINAIQQALKQGHYVVIATGRPVASGRKVARELGLTLPGCYMIAFNGAVLYDCAADRVLQEETLPIEYVNTLFDKAKEAGLYIQTYSKQAVLAEEHTKELDYYCKQTNINYKLVKDIKSELTLEPNKVLLIHLSDKDKLLRFQKENEEWQKGKLASFFSCDEYLEYCPLNTTKGKGVSFLCNILNITLENTIAVGDERNDISLLEQAHIGIAVKNANCELKEKADVVLEYTNNEDAIAKIIQKYILN